VKIAVDRTDWGRLRVTGGDRVRFLQGLTTVNIETLADGAHAWGAILSPKGRVLSVIDVAKQVNALVISTEAVLTNKTRAILERYAVMDDVAFEPLSGLAHQMWEDPRSVWRAPIVSGPPELSLGVPDAIERVRIRAGFLRYGVDVDEDHFPFETPLAQFLDYGKGCYVGQEPVFRVHSQGNAARMLRGLDVTGAAPIEPGAKIKHPSRDNAGEVTSAISDGERTIALGYLHRTSWDVGGEVEIAGRRAIVRELPW
jgi:folate-binding protein YgfZ